MFCLDLQDKMVKWKCTELRKSLGTWLQEISSCSSLTFLPGLAWVLHRNICEDFFSALYTQLTSNYIVIIKPGKSSSKPNDSFGREEGATCHYGFYYTFRLSGSREDSSCWTSCASPSSRSSSPPSTASTGSRSTPSWSRTNGAAAGTTTHDDMMNDERLLICEIPQIISLLLNCSFTCYFGVTDVDNLTFISHM